MPQENATDHVFSFALRAGNMLLRNGSPAATVTQALLTIAQVSGFPETTATVTLGQITLSYREAGHTTPVTRVQSVGAAELDIHALVVLEHIVEDVATGTITVDEGLRRLDALEREPGQQPPLKVLGSALMGAGFGALIGAGLTACLVAAACAVVIEVIVDRLDRVELPEYYSRTIAALVAVVATGCVTHWTPVDSPVKIIIAALVTKLAGSSSISAVQDLLTGWLLTACARIVDSILMTVGLCVGTAAGIATLDRFNIHLNVTDIGSTTAPLSHAVPAAAMIATGFAFRAHVPTNRVPLYLAFGTAGYGVMRLMAGAHFSVFTSAAAAATALGVALLVLSRPLRVPATGSLDVAIVPLVPGMALYQGFAGLVSHSHAATGHLFQAAGIALSIGTGAVFGQYLASHLMWRARTTQYRRAVHRRGDGLDDTEFAARGLLTPDFRRPFTDLDERG